MAGREYREVRRRLSGPEASPFIGYARTLLGIMKDQMRFAKLSQLSYAKDFPNGVRIVVSSIFGQDEINISVPVGRPEETKMKNRKIKSRELVVAGRFTKQAGQTNIFIWRKGVGAEDIGVWGAVTGIAGDGTSLALQDGVVGAANARVARWTRSGVTYMESSRRATPFAISHHGVICGTIGWSSELEQRAFRWVPGNQYEELSPALGDTYSKAWGISHDGMIVVGQSQYKPCYWVAGDPRPIVLAYPSGYSGNGQARSIANGMIKIAGWGSIDTFTAGPLVWDKNGIATATGMPDGYTAGSSWDGVPTFISEDGVTVAGNMYRADDGQKAPFKWRSDTGLVMLTNANYGYAFGATQDATVLVGSDFVGSDERAGVWEMDEYYRLQDHDPSRILLNVASTANRAAWVETEVEIPDAELDTGA